VAGKKKLRHSVFRYREKASYTSILGFLGLVKIQKGIMIGRSPKRMSLKIEEFKKAVLPRINGNDIS